MNMNIKKIRHRLKDIKNKENRISMNNKLLLQVNKQR